eukprot:scaffold5684_cov169-Amphora_coffeaeformis.AAC.16
MEDPVTDHCAHNFERKAIETWIARGNTCCPISRKALSLVDLAPNHVLAERIEKWQWEKQHHEDIVLALKATKTEEEDDETSLDGTDSKFIMKGDRGDIEVGGHALSGTSAFKKHYDEVPTDMMLLPQEKAALERIWRRNDSLRALRKRRKCCYCTTTVCTVVLFIAAMGFYWVSFRTS